MSSRYKIRARILPLKLPNISNADEDVGYAEKKILVPMNGSQTVGDLFFEIQRIYNDLYNQAGELRIRCLETADGDLLHTSLLVSDCFEKRTSINDSSQWTVMVKRQAPTKEEIEEHQHNARQFTFDDLSFVRPQIPYSQGLPEIQELSATPFQKQLGLRAPIPSDTVEALIQTTERDENDSQKLAARHGRRSPSLVPNSQLPLALTRSTLNTTPNNTTQQELTGAPRSGISKAPRSVPRKSGSLDEIEDSTQDSKLQKKASTKKGPNAIDSVPKKTGKRLALREDVFNIKNVRQSTPQQMLKPRRTLSSEERLPQSRRSSLDDQKKTAAKDTDRLTTKLEASLARERAKTQELVANLPITPTPQHSQKLTPFFPHSMGKFTSDSTQNGATSAADTGIELLRDNQSAIQNGSSSQAPNSRPPLQRFSPDHFKEVDRRAIARIIAESQLKPIDGLSNGIKYAEKLSAKPVADHSSSKHETDEQSEQNGDAETARSSSPTHPDVSQDDKIPEHATKGPAEPTVSIQTTARPRGRPRKNPNVTVIKTTEAQETSSARSSFSTHGDRPVVEGDQPVKRGRGRPPGSKSKPKVKQEVGPKTEQKTVAPKPDGSNGKKIGRPLKATSKSEQAAAASDSADGTVKKRRGRPPGVKNKIKSEAENPMVSDKQSKKAKTVKKSAEPETDSEELRSSADTVPNNSKKSVPMPNTGKRKHTQEDSPKPAKRTKKTADSPEVANAGAMDEANDREAVIYAADAMDVNQSSSAVELPPSPQLQPEPLAEHESPTEADDESETDSLDEDSETEPETAPETAKLERSGPEPSVALPESSDDSRSESDNEIEPKLPPLYSELQESSSDDAAAQLQIEETTSLEQAPQLVPKGNASISSRPAPAFQAASTRYVPFSELKKQSTSSQQPVYSPQTNLRPSQKMSQNLPTKQDTSSDDSDSSSESDSESDSARAVSQGKGVQVGQNRRVQTGFNRLVKKVK